MKGGTWRASPLALTVTVLIAAVAGLGCVLATRSVDSQNQALLKDEATQAAEYVSSLATNLGSTLEALAPGVTTADASPSAFVTQARPLSAGSFSFVLAHRAGAGFEVTAAVGPGFRSGQILGPRVSDVLARAGADLTPGPVHYDGKSTMVGLALGPPVVPPGTAIYEQITIDPYLGVTAAQAAPFRVLNAAVYASAHPATALLVLANTRHLPLEGSRARAPVSVGSARWWLVAAARSPLAGAFPNSAPLIVLAVGLLLALAVGITVEVVVRRERYATGLVAERTEELLASQEEVVRSERLSAIGRMTTVIGHELRNPLGVILNSLFMLRRTVGDPEAAEPHLAMAERHTERAVGLAQDLTSYMREREPHPEPVDLKVALSEVLETIDRPTGVEVVDDVSALLLEADTQQLAQIFTNLVSNAYQAMPEGGVLRVSSRTEDGSVVMAFEDSGDGIDDELRERLFEPFVTTKSEGTGLGLAIVRRLAEAHGGTVSIENGTDRGAVVSVVLPLRSPVEP